METSKHAIHFYRDETDEEYWLEVHQICIEANGIGKVRTYLSQEIIHSKQVGPDSFFCEFPIIVVYSIYSSEDDDDMRFAQELSCYKGMTPFSVGNDFRIRLGFSTLVDAMEFSTTQLENIKKAAVKIVNP